MLPKREYFPAYSYFSHFRPTFSSNFNKTMLSCYYNKQIRGIMYIHSDCGVKTNAELMYDRCPSEGDLQP